MTDTTHYADDRNSEGVYIPKSYQFERDMDRERPDKRGDQVIFDESSNEHYIYEDIDSLLINLNDLSDMLKDFIVNQKGRLNILDDYSKGRNYNVTHGRRRLEPDKADYRVSHNWGGYISNFITGYLMSRPITITYFGDETNQDLEDVNLINQYNDIDTLNFQLGYDTSRFGRAFELHYIDEDKMDRIELIDATEMFVIRDTTVSKTMIGAVHCPIFNGIIYPTLYTADKVIEFEPVKEDSPKLTIKNEKPHFYLDVPVVEWWNNRFRQGDFETVISLLDAYDAAQSDTANYMSDMNDALLVLAGDLEGAGITTDDAIKMKEANMLLLESGLTVDGRQTSVSAEYIYKQYDVAGTEAYKRRVLDDIYKLSYVPNLDDDRFYSGQSGIALQYKMIGLEQVRSSKESFYTKALRRRYKLIENVHKELKMEPIDSGKLRFTFHENIPQDVWAEIQAYIASGGDISQETLRELTTFTTHDEEEVRLNKEREPYLSDYELVGEDIDKP